LYCSTEFLGTYIFSIRVALNGLFTKAGGFTALIVIVLSCWQYQKASYPITLIVAGRMTFSNAVQPEMPTVSISVMPSWIIILPLGAAPV